MRRKKEKAHSEPTLVPLADMLTTTVRITIFIMIFTVLTAGGAVIAKRLPMEHSTTADSLVFYCWNNRVLVLEEDSAIDAFRKPLGQPTYDTLTPWISKFNKHKLEVNDFWVTGEGEVSYSFLSFFSSSARLDLTVVFQPKPGAGEDAQAVKDPDSRFRKFLAGNSPEKHFVYFLVRPDSLAAVDAAREVALQMGYETGWWPEVSDDSSVRFGLTGGGNRPRPQ